MGMRWPRGCTVLAALVLALGVLAGWRIVSLAMAGRLASTDPDAALSWVSAYPDALVERARRSLATGELGKAEDDARSVLAGEPLNGEAYSLIARAAQARAAAREAHPGQHSQVRVASAKAARLSAIAVRRNPRDVGTRAWLAQRALQQRAYPAALTQLAAILRLSPRLTQVLVPRIAELAADPEFAQALGDVLEAQPRWRNALMSKLVSEAARNDVGLATLQARRVLTSAEFSAWLDALLENGRADEAYARWAGRQITAAGGAGPVGTGPAATSVPALANPAFDASAFDTTFGWQRVDRAGATFVAQGRGRETVAWQVHLESPGTVYLWQRLLLRPGHYRVQVDMRVVPDYPGDPRAVAPRWSFTCVASGREMSIEAPEVDAEWHRVVLDAVVASDCPQQILRLQSDPDVARQDRAMRVSLGRARLVRLPPLDSTMQPSALDIALGNVSGIVLLDHGLTWTSPGNAEPGLMRAGERLLIGPEGSVAIIATAGCAGGVVDRVGIYSADELCAANRNAAPVADAATSAAAQTLHHAVVQVHDQRDLVPTGR